MMEQKHVGWAPFPADDLTNEDFVNRLQTLEDLVSKGWVAGLYSSDSEQRRRAIYDFTSPIFDIVKSIGKPVEVPVYAGLGRAEKIGRAKAGFAVRSKPDGSFAYKGYSVDEIGITASDDDIVIILSENSGEFGNPVVFLFLPLENSKENFTFLDLNGEPGKKIMEFELGGVLMPEQTDALQTILLQTSKALLAEARNS